MATQKRIKTMNNKLIYLAIPYTWNPEKSFEIANKVTADLMKKGNIVISPISQSHLVANYLDKDLRCNQEFWMGIDLPILKRCNELIVVKIHTEKQNADDIIENSKGCLAEIRCAIKNRIHVKFYNYYG